MNRLLLALSLTIGATACATEEPPKRETKPVPKEEATGPSLTVELAGGQWEVIAIRGEDATPGMGAMIPHLVFVDETKAAFSGGCNQHIGSYLYDWPEDVSFDENFASTRKACPAPVMAQDQALAGALAQAAKILPSDTGKIIIDAEGVELVALRPMPPM